MLTGTSHPGTSKRTLGWPLWVESLRTQVNGPAVVAAGGVLITWSLPTSPLPWRCGSTASRPGRRIVDFVFDSLGLLAQFLFDGLWPRGASLQSMWGRPTRGWSGGPRRWRSARAPPVVKVICGFAQGLRMASWIGGTVCGRRRCPCRPCPGAGWKSRHPTLGEGPLRGSLGSRLCPSGPSGSRTWGPGGATGRLCGVAFGEGEPRRVSS